jgi:hypothetical protein
LGLPTIATVPQRVVAPVRSLGGAIL